MGLLELKVPPPIVTALFAAGMWWVATLVPGATRAFPGRGAIAVGLAVAGVLAMAAGIRAFVRHGTTTNPMAPERASALVRDGVYRATRNPMYLGMTILLIGWAVWLGSWLAAALVAGFVAWITRFQIIPEERILRARFGADFEAYAASVRRWV